MKIESHDIDLESLLTGGYYFIPRFQRPYSWDSENIQSFWDDINENKDDEYFIGSMVVFKKAKQEYGVVDGQQRLTTITVLLCSLRDAFREIGEMNLAEGVHNLIERKNIENKFEYVLRTETSFPYFQEHILKFPEEPELTVSLLHEEKNLSNGHVQFKKLISDVMNSVDSDPSIIEDKKQMAKVAKLESIRNAILNLKIIFIKLDDEDDAYLIFETLNTRGKDLALTDLAKNHFAKLIKRKGSVDHAKLKWKQILETIHESAVDISTDTFIYHFWASRFESVPLKKLFPKLKKAVTKSNAKEYLNFLEDDAQLYRSLFETQYYWTKNELEVAKSLDAMQLFKLSQPIPATLALVRAFREGKIKHSKLRDTLKSIEHFHFHFTAITSSRSSGGISAMYSAFAQKLYLANNSQQAGDEIKILVNKLKIRVPSFDEFQVAFKEVIFTNKHTKQTKLVRYILDHFTRHYSYAFPGDLAELTIEHIYPQSGISEDWPVEIVGQLGNLIYLEEKLNGRLADKSFLDKKKILDAAGHAYPENIKDCQDWTVDAVVAHSEEMAEIAYYKIWTI